MFSVKCLVLSGELVGLFLGFLLVGHLPGVEEVLVDAVEGHGYGGERVEECVGHPDAHGAVFLAEELSAGDGVAVAVSEPTAEGELDDAEEEGEAGEPDDGGEVALSVDEDEVDGLAEGESECHGPEVESDVVVASEECAGARHEELQECGEEEGECEGGAYLAEDEKHVFAKRQFGVVADECEDDGSDDGDDDVVEDGVGGDGFAVGAEDAGYDGDGGGDGAEDADEDAFGDDVVAAEECDGGVEADAYNELEGEEPDVEWLDAQPAQVDGGEGEEEDGEDEEWRKKGECAADAVEEEADEDGDGEDVWSEVGHSGELRVMSYGL